ncbi:CapA family protein [bacterium]|nr:CapA family protein [bacterium]
MRIACVLACALVVCGTVTSPTRADDATPASPVRLLFAGDVMLDGGPGHAITKGIDPFADFAAQLQAADFAICNLECVISDRGRVAHKPYTFRGAQGSLPLLKRHFDAVSVANNHALDFGIDGFAAQLELQKSNGLPFFGGGATLEEARRPLILTKNGCRIALLGYNEFLSEDYAATPNQAGIAPFDMTMIIADIRRAREIDQAHIVIPYVHWGTELEPEPEPVQHQWARQMIDAGASAVVGSHPHVTQTVEIYRGKPIIYSLGNFVFDYFPGDPPTWVGWLAELTVSTSGSVDLDLTAFEIDPVGIPRRITQD